MTIHLALSHIIVIYKCPHRYTNTKRSVRLYNNTDNIMILTLILTHCVSIVFHLFIIRNPGGTTGRTRLDHVRLNLFVLLTNPSGRLTGNKLNSTTPRMSLCGCAGHHRVNACSISGTRISVHKVPHLHWIQQPQHDDQTALPDMIHASMTASVMGSSSGVYVTNKGKTP